MLDRRAFLRVAGGVVAGFSCGGVAASVPEIRRRVVIIGAGIAGLTAARKLIEAGCEVLVVEARERIGGRIVTAKSWTDAPMDLGASWIHGIRGNPISALAREAGVRVVTTSYDNSVCYDTGGKALDDAGQTRMEQLEKTLNRCLQSAQEEDKDQSIQSAVSGLLNAGGTAPGERTGLEFLLNSTIEQEYGGSIAELSAHWYDDDASFSGGDALFPGGYQVIPEFLAKGVPVDLGQTVSRVEWGPKQAVVTTDKAVHTADSVLITLPLGVLKSGKIDFSPGLPERKSRAISTLGMGVLNKCFLRFPSVFWPATADWLEYIPQDRGRWTEWVNFFQVCGKPVLLGFNAADFGREIESWSDSDIVADAMGTLRTVFGQGIPDPLDFKITRWASDPFALGSYSFNAIGSNPRMRDDLAKPVDGRLFFAGEATDRRYFGTVHGAYFSGIRAAGEILAGS